MTRNFMAEGHTYTIELGAVTAQAQAFDEKEEILKRDGELIGVHPSVLICSHFYEIRYTNLDGRLSFVSPAAAMPTAEEIRARFIKRVENGEIDAWALWKPAASNLLLWAYADDSYTRWNGNMRWDGSGIEPAIFALVDDEWLKEQFDYGDDWQKFKEEYEELVKQAIVEYFCEHAEQQEVSE